MKVLLVEDDLRFARVLGTALRRAGYELTHVGTATEALAAAPADVVLLDLNLPDWDGLHVCRELRARSEVVIIVLSARSEESERIAGLRAGADDYLVKPFSFGELQARIEAVLRRARPRPAGVREIGTLRVDLDRHEAFVSDERLSLSRKEFQLLALLSGEPGTVQRRDRLMIEVWNTSWPGTSRTLDVHIARLRAKVEGSVHVEAIRGVGYRLVPVDGSGPGPAAPIGDEADEVLG
ncbi:response regulator transcription factor [Solwaraspora sp. WMMD406]|uniref:response regulator transcription factor n=1 Tax=Solwaraspora sp. WMMD406 TaxID=3016095 RepID=UPI0024171FC4|nr:response regulator transcription factor [Solwaraspora sp. WMMD406]MDG4765055.1 response regulator transcription factor [Solwaraspora sp. WMMD406]